MKRVIAMLLAAVLCIGTVIPAAAEEVPASTYQQYNKVFFMGDSNSMGYGLKGYKDYESNDFVHCLQGSFPQIVADAVQPEGCKGNLQNRVNMAFPALRAKDVLQYIGGEPYAFSERDLEHQKGFFYEELPAAEKDKLGEGGYSKALEDADLVVVELGAADLILCTYFAAFGYGDDTAAIVSNLVAEMFTNYAELQVEFPRLLARIREMNEDCRIVVVGTWNPVRDLVYDDDSVIPLLEAFAFLTQSMNEDYKAWAKEYGASFADVANVDTCTVEEGITIDGVLTGEVDLQKTFHASPSGYEYIARQILDCLKTEKQPVTTNISIDLISAASVQAVTVDKKIITGFTFDPDTATVTIPYSSRNASVVTVTFTGEDGKTCFATYQVSWKAGVGYTNYRLYATRNVVATVTNVSGTLQRLISRIKGWFVK